MGAALVVVLAPVVDEHPGFGDARELLAVEQLVSGSDRTPFFGPLLEVAPPADADPDGEWRTTLVERFASVRAFVALLCEAIEFGATAQAAGILTAIADLPALLDARATTAVPTGYLDARRIADDVVPAG